MMPPLYLSIHSNAILVHNRLETSLAATLILGMVSWVVVNTQNMVHWALMLRDILIKSVSFSFILFLSQHISGIKNITKDLDYHLLLICVPINEVFIEF